MSNNDINNDIGASEINNEKIRNKDMKDDEITESVLMEGGKRVQTIVEDVKRIDIELATIGNTEI